MQDGHKTVGGIDGPGGQLCGRLAKELPGKCAHQHKLAAAALVKYSLLVKALTGAVNPGCSTSSARGLPAGSILPAPRLLQPVLVVPESSSVPICRGRPKRVQHEAVHCIPGRRTCRPAALSRWSCAPERIQGASSKPMFD